MPLIPAHGKQRQVGPCGFEAGLFSLQGEFQESYDYIVRPCLKNSNPTNQPFKDSWTSQSKTIPEYNDNQRTSRDAEGIFSCCISCLHGLMKKTPWNTMLKIKKFFNVTMWHQKSTCQSFLLLTISAQVSERGPKFYKFLSPTLVLSVHLRCFCVFAKVSGLNIAHTWRNSNTQVFKIQFY